jgi:twitching motility protein PilT
MRDLETISTALTAAETGHLVLATLHTNGAPDAITRAIDVFPPHQQTQVRTQLAMSLEGVLAQQLLATKELSERVLATELLLANSAVRNLIRENKCHQLRSVMQTGGEAGMHTMDSSLSNLYSEGLINQEEALRNSKDQAALKNLL